ncbi:MAG: penicillin-binding protein [Prevotellaceae bacterium]|jgi:penicillin-binding protein 1A|nr:penicillin-binding protein [Prevotellaceae bacterium]
MNIRFFLHQLKQLFLRFRLRRKHFKMRLKQRPFYVKIVYYTFKAIIIFLLYLLMVDMNFLWLFGKSPDMDMVKHPPQNLASEIYSADGKRLGKYFRENRLPATYDEVSFIMKRALIEIEDERFRNHSGIDVQGLFSSVKDMMFGRARGASTITQQLVKNMFHTRSAQSRGLLGHIPYVDMLIIKTKEWTTALKIESMYSKNEILTMYLNTVDFGSNAFGIKTAAKIYFNTTPDHLKVEQAATLVGMLKATTTYNPRLNPVNSFKRRNVVLEMLAKKHIITRAECDSLKKLPIVLEGSVEENYSGTALYFREKVAESLKDWCKENEIDLYSDGLKIYTTIDTRMQQYAEEAVTKQMSRVQRSFNNHWGKNEPWVDENNQVIKNFIEDLAKRTPEYKKLSRKYARTPDSIWFYLDKPRKMKVFHYDTEKRDTTFSTMDSIRYMTRFLHAGFVVIEPETGFVKAWVGDVDFNYWKYDKVTSLRQPGSTFKIFDYTAAFMQGKTPCSEETNSYVEWKYTENGAPKTWIPRNITREYGGDTVTLKYAFARSYNVIAAKIAKDAGIENVIETAYKMGIKTPLHNMPATSLGSSDVSLLELTNAYCTVIDDGYYQEPVLVTKIVGKEGNVIYEHKPKKERAIPYETAFLMTQMLLGGLTEPYGTTQSLWEHPIFNQSRKIDGKTVTMEYGGKTGTSSNYSDAWFMGVTPHLVGGSWVGGEYRSIHFRNKLGEGGHAALPIFGYFMEQLLNDKKFEKYIDKFPKPKEKISVDYYCHTPWPKVKDTLNFDANEESVEPVPIEEE